MTKDFHSIRGLAWQIGVPLAQLRALAANVETEYHPFESRQPGKRARLIDNPTNHLKQVQRSIRQNVLSPHPLDESVRACVKGGSPRKHASAVANQRNVSETDLKSCYPKITNQMVFRRLRELGYGPGPASLLTRLMTRAGHVPQGAPTSDVIVNQVLTPLDKVAKAIAEERGLRYSRCMDGFVIAGANGTREALELIVDAILAAGLAVRRSKTRNAGVRRAQEVAGYYVNSKHGPKVRRAKRQEIRTAVHQMVLAHRRGEPVNDLFPRVRGYLAYLTPTNPGLVARLVGQITAAGIAWPR